MRKSVVVAASLPVWYQEQCERVANLSASMESMTDPDLKEAMGMLLNTHIARAAVLEELMREELAR